MEKITSIDFHAHVLPGADHGCKNNKMCVKQLIMAKEHKVDIVIATPHFYPHVDSVASFLVKRKGAIKEYERINGENLPKVLMGAEVLIWPGMDQMEDIDKLCVEGTNILLIEMPFSKHWEDALIETVININKKFKVVLAHVERYPIKQVEKLTSKGIVVQLNAKSIQSISKFGKCRYWMNTDKVVAIGSDIHGIANNYHYFEKVAKSHKGNAIMEKTNRLISTNIRD